MLLKERLPCQRSAKYFDSKPRAFRKSARELPHFYNTTKSEAKETIIKENESEGDDTEELYQ